MISQEDVPTILQEFVQPRVINQDMLINLIIEQGPKGEAGKLFFEDGINLNEIKEIRIEFLNILKIDHLWAMPNLVKLKLSNNIIEKIENLDVLIHLKELDLSFNRIKIMENLDNLTKLEILLLYNNGISKVEGMDNLYNLTIFSIGNNAIADWEHVMSGKGAQMEHKMFYDEMSDLSLFYSNNAKINMCTIMFASVQQLRTLSLQLSSKVIYLRKFRKLSSLNTNGNPCTEDSGYLDYVFAFIPQLIYYEYKMITTEERETALKQHYRALNTVEETEAKEKEQLDIQEKYEENLAVLTNAFMEYLDDDYLFNQMFTDDKEGIELSMINEDTQNAYEEYKQNFITLCKEFCDIGLKAHEKRMDEIKLFTKATNEGKEASQNRGRLIVNEVLQKKSEVLMNVKQLLKKLVGDVDSATLEDVTQKAQQLAEEFTDIITDTWTKLMSIEIELHEQMQEVNEVFRINMTDLVDSFLTTARGYFSQIRNCEAEYNDAINGLVLYYISGIGDDAKIPKHLVNLCGDKDILTYTLANSHEKHLQVIDAREDSMASRLRNWLEEYTGQLVKYENERNNQQILEISHFADSQQTEFYSLELLQQLNINVDDPEIIEALD